MASNQTQFRELLKQEIALIKMTFKDNDFLLFAIRKFFFQWKLTEDEQKVLEGFSANKPVIALLKSMIFPDADSQVNCPLFEPVDLWCQVNLMQDPDTAFWDMRSKMIVIDYFEARFCALRGGDIGGREFASLAFNKNKETASYAVEAFIDLKARNFVLLHVDKKIQQLQIIANESEETEKERDARQKKDSTE